MKRSLLYPILAAALLWAAAVPGAFAVNHLMLQTLASDPPDESPAPVTPRPREKGRKAVRVRFGFVDDFGTPQPGGFPINAGGASVQLSVNGTAHFCTPTLNPPANECGFVTAPFDAMGAADTLKIYFNGNFPAGATIVATVSGVVSAGAVAQDASPNSITFLTGNTAPRTPGTVELVFDISGSMAQPAVPGGAVTRIDALKQASQALFGMMNSHTMLGDKLGAVFFSTTASGGTLQPAHDPAQLATVQSAVMAQVPTNATSIGDGLTKANLNGFAGDSNPRKFALLFSDGEQNTAPMVDADTATCDAISPLKVNGAAYPAGVTVCPITTGRLTACGYKLQQSIGNLACGGHYLHIPDSEQTFIPADAQTFFVQTLTTALIGDKLEIVRDANGNLPAGGTQTEKFLGNRGDVALSILLAWAGPQGLDERSLPFRLIAPDGTEVDTQGATRRHLGMSFTTIHFPRRQGNQFIDPKGEWRIELLGSTFSFPLDYHLVVIADNDRIASGFRTPVGDPGTGEPIPVEVRLIDDGAAVHGATVVAALAGPQNGLGDVLSRAATPSGLPNLSGDVVGSTARAKLALLLNDPAFAALLKDQALPAVTLTDDGSGVYRGTFTGAVKEGHYQFAVKARGTSATGGDFERAQRLTVFVRPKPDPARTDLVLVSSVAQPDGSLIIHLRATARDRFGSLLGPDYGPAFGIVSSLGTPIETVHDNLDGSYDVSYRLPSAVANPTITVTVMGDKVRQETLDGLRGISPLTGGGGAGRWVLSLHAGATQSHGDLGTVLSSGLSVGADLEYRFTPLFSLETYLGHDRFDGKSGIQDFYFTHLSEQARLTFGGGPVRASLFAGVGVYDGSSGGSHFGYSLGGSLQYWVLPRLGLEASYVWHDVRLSGGDARYSTLLAGLRWTF